jgi:hypothetical protein
MKVRNVSLVASITVLVLLSGMPVLSSGSVANYASARYAPADTQSQGNSNECDTGSNCGITSPQSQGDGTANSPVNTQISGFNEEQGAEGSLGEDIICILAICLIVTNCNDGGGGGTGCRIEGRYLVEDPTLAGHALFCSLPNPPGRETTICQIPDLQIVWTCRVPNPDPSRQIILCLPRPMS